MGWYHILAIFVSFRTFFSLLIVLRLSIYDIHSFQELQGDGHGKRAFVCGELQCHFLSFSIVFREALI